MTSKATNRADRQQDKAVEDTFPASDPPANSGVTRAGRADKPPHERTTEERPTGRPTSDRHATETAHHWEDENKTG
jgi:hypothetical protein